MERDEAIQRIKSALKRRSGKSWSVTGGRGTAWGWITIDAPPRRCTEKCRLKAGALSTRPEDYENYDSGTPGGHMTKADRVLLAKLMGLESVHFQGISIPASTQYRQEHVDRAEDRAPSVIGEPYWD